MYTAPGSCIRRYNNNRCDEITSARRFAAAAAAYIREGRIEPQFNIYSVLMYSLIN